jgi:hypothetical protein
MIFVHPFNDNFEDNLVFLFSYWPKTMEREKGREMIRISCEYEREKIVQKLSQIVVQISFL